MKRQKITKENLLPLAKLQCTMKEFCAAFEVCENTMQNRIQELFDMKFSEFMEYYGSLGHTSLRRAMWTNALKGNHKVQIFLAKNHLGMAEKSEEKRTDEVIITRIIDSIDVDQKIKPAAKKDKPKQKKKTAKKPATKKAKAKGK
jgi:hypothetical protein